MLLSTLRMLPASAAALALLLFFGVLTVWHPARWPLSVSQAGVFALSLSWAARLIRSPRRLHTGFPALPLAGAALWALLQLATRSTVYRFETWKALLYWAAGLVFYLLARQICEDHPLRYRFLRALVYFGFAVSVLAVTQYFTSKGKIFWVFPSGYSEALGPFVSRNTYAAFIELVLPLALVESVHNARRSVLWTLVSGTMFASVVAGASRAGTLLVALEVVAVPLLAARRRPVETRVLLTRLAKTTAVAAAFTGVVGWQVICNRFQAPDPFAGRRELLASTLKMISERPWLGFGLGTWPTVYPAYALLDVGRFANHAHNDWAEWAAEGGVPFAVLLASLAVWSALQVVRFPWGLGVPCVFLHCVVDFPMQNTALAALAFALLGALAAARKVE